MVSSLFFSFFSSFKLAKEMQTKATPKAPATRGGVEGERE